MIKNATGNCFWRYDQEDDYRLSFVARHADGGEEVLYHFRAFELEKFLSIAVLIGEHQHQWGEWRKASERVKGPALDGILSSIWKTDYLENVEDVIIAKHPSQKNSVTMSIRLLPKRRVDVIRHRFRTPELRSAFLGWVEKGGYARRVRLSLIGLLEGKKALGEKLDAFAEAEFGFGQKVMNAMIAAIEEGRDEVFIPGYELPDWTGSDGPTLR